MVLDDVPQLGTLTEVDDMHSLNSNSTKIINANGAGTMVNIINANGAGTMVNGIDQSTFIMEDLNQSKEENQDANTVVKVELSSLSVLTVNDTQSHSNGGNGPLNGQHEELGSDKVDGDIGPVDEHKNKESSVRVVFNCLPSRSKRKLEELLHQWSEWHAQNVVSSEDPASCVESGEEIYFPALRVGSGKSPAVSFSMDVPDPKRQRKDSFALSDCSSRYDRGYAVGLSSNEGMTEEITVDLREAPRCFNCGSFNHPLKDCQKPFNRAAVSSARKEFSNKKNLNSGPRIPTRYYQDSPGGKFSSGGKFDGLKPGSLSPETKKVLGLGELDPPPWLNRMRELGYPPGYLDSEEGQPSGIEIFGDEKTQNVEVGNNLPLEVTKSEKKMTVDFPGMNAPIPENADLKIWTALVPLGPDFSFHQPDNGRWRPPQDSTNNGPFNGADWLMNHLEAQSSQFGIGLSPPQRYDHFNNYHPREPFGHPREPFSPRGIMIPPGSPHYGRYGDAGRPPMHHHNMYGSL